MNEKTPQIPVDVSDIQWLTPEEAGARIPGGLGAAAMRKWARNGKLPGAIQLPNKHWLIPSQTIDEILANTYKNEN